MDAECGEGVKLVWDPSDRPGGWEVAYGPAGTPPDSCTVVPCDEPLLVLDSCIEAGVHYVAYVRKVCGNKVIQYYSEWSDGVEVCRTNRYTVVAEANNADRGQVGGGFRRILRRRRGGADCTTAAEFPFLTMERRQHHQPPPLCGDTGHGVHRTVCNPHWD